MDKLEIQEALLPAARELLNLGGTMGAGKKAFNVAVMYAALEKVGNNQSAAARLLAIPQGSISRAVSCEALLARFADTHPGRPAKKTAEKE